MVAPSSAPTTLAELEQVERYEFTLRFPGHAYGPFAVDEPPPVGHDSGPGPVAILAAAVGHCMSSTLTNTLERAHVKATPLRTTVTAEVGRNPRGRLRVLRLAVSIVAAPLAPEDQERFDHCVAIFEDFCTVSGAVREGVNVSAVVGSTADPAKPDRA